MTDFHAVTLELVRPGPPHYQLLNCLKHMRYVTNLRLLHYSTWHDLLVTDDTKSGSVSLDIAQKFMSHRV